MRILLDTNIILDLFLEREPFVEDAALIWKAHEGSHLTAYSWLKTGNQTVFRLFFTLCGPYGQPAGLKPYN